MNKKGITLIELIVSIALISIIILFLFRLLIDVRYSDNKIDYARKNQQTRAIIIKTVQDDFLDYGLVGLDDASSSNDQLIVDFTFSEGKTGKLIVTSNSVTYKKANGETEKWTLDSSIGTYNIHCVKYSLLNNSNDFFSIHFRIPLIVSKTSKNTIDDLEFFYIGKTLDVNEKDFVGSVCLGHNCDTSSC